MKTYDFLTYEINSVEYVDLEKMVNKTIEDYENGDGCWAEESCPEVNISIDVIDKTTKEIIKAERTVSMRICGDEGFDFEESYGFEEAEENGELEEYVKNMYEELLGAACEYELDDIIEDNFDLDFIYDEYCDNKYNEEVA